MNAPSPSRARLPRSRVVLASLALAVVMTGGGLSLAGITSGATPDPHSEEPAATAEVHRGDLKGATNVAGTLTYADPVEVQTRAGGVVTWLPAAGTRIRQGQALYAIDNRRIRLLHGRLPAWRTFASGMSGGPDVRQLERALRRLGHFSGTPDEHFDWSTARAVRTWQKATGQQQTGRILLGEVVFQPTDMRVDQRKASIGDQVVPGDPILSLSSLAKQVTVELSLSEQRLASRGARVQIRLPDGNTVRGTVTSVGVPTPQTVNDPTSPTIIPVVVGLGDQGAAGAFQQANVVVTFPTGSRKDVLSVPLSALIALPGGRFGVHVVGADGDTRQVPVTTGLFAGDRVEVSGDLYEGEKVQVPTS